MKSKWEQVGGYGLIVVASCFWGSSASLGKKIMQSGISTFTLMEIRSVISATILLILLAALAPKHLRIKRNDWPGLILLALPGLALVNASYYNAIRLIPVAVAVFIQFTAPVFIFLYGLLRKRESMTAIKVMALALCMAGTFLMVEIQQHSGAPIPAAGVWSAIISMLSYAFYIIHSHNLGKKHSPWTINAFGYGIASLFWLLVVNCFDAVRQLNSLHLWGAAFGFAFCSTLIPFSLFLIGLRRVSPTGASIVSTSETVAASLFAFLFLGETISGLQIAGAALILAAVFILVVQKPEIAPEVV